MIETLLTQMQAGNRRALSRLLTQIENSSETAVQIIQAIYTQTGQAHIVGITGSPGSGKSSLVTELTKAFRRKERSVAIIAVDPSSPFSGGALLGDRVRMNELAGDKGVFIRSLASRGSLGGLAKAANQMAQLLDAAGFDLILIETVGAGQSEVDIVHTAHTTVVIEAPGMGDGVQSIKAGILEIADILVVNKADLPGSAKTTHQLKNMLHLGPIGGTRHHGRILQDVKLTEAETNAIWQVPVIPTSATTGDGIEALADTILQHRTHLESHKQWSAREKERSEQGMTQLIQERLLAYLNEKVPQTIMQQKITAVANREIDLFTAVDELIQKLGEN